MQSCRRCAPGPRRLPAAITGAAADKLAGALPELDRLGGSHAQREIFEDTYIAACLRAGRYDTAAERLSARLARRPSARDRTWLATRSG